MAKKKAKKKVSKKTAAADVDAPVDGSEPDPAPAIAEEATYKVMDKGQATFYTETEYRKKYGRKR